MPSLFRLPFSHYANTVCADQTWRSRMKMISLERIARNHQRILVDGKLWGHVKRFSAGSNGSYYCFRDTGTSGFLSERISDEQYPVICKVWTERTASRHARDRGETGPLAPLQFRIIAEIARLIDTGVLVSPEILIDRAAKKQRFTNGETKKRAEIKREQYRQKVEREITMKLVAMAGLAGKPDMVTEKVIELMMWANEGA
jgi:hypothetical protein